ncbi:MAG TPA: hypothetical protein VFI11_12830, partial [Anaerolineales bacterium]|nr:hypothetical protein [Anaerolineales bacterium]
MPLTNPIVQWRQRRLLRDLSTRIANVEAYLAGREAHAGAQDGPVLFFNASTRIHRLSLNGAFSLLSAWAVRAAGHEVRHLVCEAGMEPCVLGTDRRSPASPPPCSICLDLSRTIFPAGKTQGL